MSLLLFVFSILAIGFVVVPLLIWRSKTSVGQDIDRAALLKDIHEDREAEVVAKADPDLQRELELEIGSVLLAEHEDLQSDSQTRPGDDLVDRSGTNFVRSNLAYWLIVPLFPILAWGIYLYVADPDQLALRGAEEVMQLQVPDQQAEVVRWKEILTERVKGVPEDSKSWYLLGHTHLKLGEFSAAAESFASTDQLTLTDLTVKVYWLQSRYLAARGVVDQTSQKIIEDILSQQPNNPIALEISALNAFAKGDKAQAVALLNRAISGSMDPAQQASFGQAIRQIRENMESAPAGVTVQVSTDEINQVPHRSVLFVIARPVGGGMPYAVVRRPGVLLPLTLRLDDLVSMSPDRTLADAQEFEVVVRLSLSGQPMANPEDWQWVSDPLSLEKLSDNNLGVTITPPEKTPQSS